MLCIAKTFSVSWEHDSHMGYLYFCYHSLLTFPLNVTVPLRGSYLLNWQMLQNYAAGWWVAVPLRGSYLLNPVLYSPLFMLVPDPFCVAKPFSAYLITQKTQKPPANPLKSSCAGKHIWCLLAKTNYTSSSFPLQSSSLKFSCWIIDA